MKKFYLFLIAALVGIAANAADYYIIGGFNNWNQKQASCKFTDQGDGTYVLDYKGTLTPGFKINDGTWTNDNINFGSNGSNLVVGTPYRYAVGGSTGNINMSENVTNPHIVLNPTAGTLLVQGEAKVAEYIYGLHGDFMGVSSWATYSMTEVDGKWVLENAQSVGGNFGIKQMDKDTKAQTSWISASTAAGANIVLDQAIPCKVEGTNFKIAAGTYNFVFDPKAMTLTVTAVSTEVTYPETLYVIGNVLGSEFAANKGVALTAGEPGMFSGEVEFTGTLGIMDSYFSLAVSLGANSGDWAGLGVRYGAKAGDTVVNGEEQEIVFGENAFKVPNGGKYTLYVNLVDMTLKAVKYVEPTFDFQPVVTDYNGTAVNGTISTGGNAPVWYSFEQTEGVDIYYSLSLEGAAAVKALAAEPEAGYTLYDGGYVIIPAKATGYLNYYAVEAATGLRSDVYSIALDAATTGIEAIGADAAEAVYYNLQGVRVAAPAAGNLYIVVKGNKVEKVMAR